MVTGRVRALPRRLSFVNLHDPALLSDPVKTRPALRPEIPSDWIRDGMHFAISEELVICRLATIGPDREHPSNGTAMWAYTYIHGLRIAPQNPLPAGTAVGNLPALSRGTRSIRRQSRQS